jgi:hypothetical protein
MHEIKREDEANMINRRSFSGNKRVVEIWVFFLLRETVGGRSLVTQFQDRFEQEAPTSGWALGTAPPTKSTRNYFVFCLPCTIRKECERLARIRTNSLTTRTVIYKRTNERLINLPLQHTSDWITVVELAALNRSRL